MFATPRKIWADLLINPANGRYSMKRCSAFACLVLFILGNLISYVDLSLSSGFDIKLRIPGWEQLALLLLGTFGYEGLVLIGHINARKTMDGNGQPLNPAYNDIPPVPDNQAKPPLE